MLNVEEQKYLDDRRKVLLKLEPHMPDHLALFRHIVYGARTIADCMRMEEASKQYHEKVALEMKTRAIPRKVGSVSDQLMHQHLRCGDNHGCGLFEGEGY